MSLADREDRQIWRSDGAASCRRAARVYIISYNTLFPNFLVVSQSKFDGRLHEKKSECT